MFNTSDDYRCTNFMTNLQKAMANGTGRLNLAIAHHHLSNESSLCLFSVDESKLFDLAAEFNSMAWLIPATCYEQVAQRIVPIQGEFILDQGVLQVLFGGGVFTTEAPILVDRIDSGWHFRLSNTNNEQGHYAGAHRQPAYGQALVTEYAELVASAANSVAEYIARATSNVEDILQVMNSDEPDYDLEYWGLWGYPDGFPGEDELRVKLQRDIAETQTYYAANVAKLKEIYTKASQCVVMDEETLLLSLTC